ncbi:hypothetical protein AMTRI_Chr01g107110 [Amborella trichopoda]
MDPSRAAPPRVPSSVHPRPAMTHLSTPWPDREPQNGHKKTARAHARAHARDAQSAHGTRHLGTLARRTHARTAVGSPSASLPTTRSPPRGPRPIRRGCAVLGLAGGTRGTVGLDAQLDSPSDIPRGSALAHPGAPSGILRGSAQPVRLYSFATPFALTITSVPNLQTTWVCLDGATRKPPRHRVPRRSPRSPQPIR